MSGEPQFIITLDAIITQATHHIVCSHIRAAVAAHAPQVRECFGIGFVVDVVVYSGREVTCYRTLLLSLRVHDEITLT